MNAMEMEINEPMWLGKRLCYVLSKIYVCNKIKDTVGRIWPIVDSDVKFSLLFW